MASVFDVRTSRDQSRAEELPDFAHDAPLDSDEAAIDENANLFVIPIGEEIAPDFELYGCDTTVRHIEELLSQGGKRRSVLLYGENGVGKTAITHGIVKRKNDRDLSIHMYKRTFWRLNSSKLLHTDDVTQINKQFDLAVGELGKYDVLVIESFYNFCMYLKTKGANYVLISFIEALSRQKFQAIVTCSVRQKTLLLSEVPELHEFFTAELVNEPSGDELLNILRGIRKSYEKRYGVTIADESLRMIRDLTQKYRNGFEEFAQPGRALVLLDRSIAQFSVKMNSKSPELCSLENEFDAATNEIQSLTTSTNEADVERREKLDARLTEIIPRLTALRREWDEQTAPIRDLQLRRSTFDTRHRNYAHELRNLQDLRSNAVAASSESVGARIERLTKMQAVAEREINKINAQLAAINLSDQREHSVTPTDIQITCSEITGVPFTQLSENERERVMNMEKILGQRVFGQDEALAAVSNAIRRSRAGLNEDEGTPIGSFLFLGPSGVGKTELGKGLAEFVTGSASNAVRFDMSEYMESHSVSKLIGAPPGYAGYDAGGTLTEAVRLHPKSVLMFDEIEKAHPDIFKILLQVLGDARLTDGRGTLVDFRETIIILTSNIGFSDSDLNYDDARASAMDKLNIILLPEIRGRLDEIICFNRLGLDMLTMVAKKRFAAINKSISKQRFSLAVNDDDAAKFCANNQDNRYGARAILKRLKTSLEKDLAFDLLTRETPGNFTATYGEQYGFEIKFVPAVKKNGS